MALTQHWRLIPLLEGDGKTHMAVDRWLLHQHQQGILPPTLRFYRWSPPAISLGYHQRRWPRHWEQLTWQGHRIDLIRRPSGGRAVLHQGDLTYALIGSGLSGTRLEVYQQVCQFLIQGFKRLAVPLTFGEAGRGYIHNPSCFGTATGADLVQLENPACKLIGSAQFWSGGFFLQHGSIRLEPDTALYQEVFGDLDWQVPKLPDGLSALPLEAQCQKIIEALTEAATSCFDICWETVPLSLTEVDQAVSLFSLEV